MSKRDLTRRKQPSQQKTLPSGINKFVAQLVALGCDEQKLRFRLERFFQQYETSKKQQIDNMLERREASKRIRSATEQIRRASKEIRFLQETSSLEPNPLAPLTLKASLGKQSPAVRRAIAVYEALPDLLEKYASAVEPEIDFIGTLLSRDGAKWMLIQYVEQATGSPHYDLLSFLLSAGIEELGLKRPIAGREDLSGDALRKFYTDPDRKKDLPRTAGRKIFDFLRFLVRLTD